MPIHGLTMDLRNEMPQLGLLRKGAPKPKNSKKPGKDLTHFRFVCNDPNIEQRFHKVYGNQPRIINVHLPFSTLEENFPTWNEEHGASGLKHRCDGKTMILWQDQDGLYHTHPEPCPYADLPEGSPDRKCSQKGLLRVWIDELGEWGYVDVVTGGIWDCINLTKNVREVENMANLASQITGRRIVVQGIPCQLKREPRMTSCPNYHNDADSPPRIRLEKWMLYLYVAPGYIQALMEEMQRYSLPVVDLPQLSALEEVSVDYYVDNGDDVEQIETEIVDDEAEFEPPVNGDGRKFYREDFVARIKELMQQAEELGEPMEVDQVILDEGNTEDLKRVGYKLREHVDALLMQTELIQDEIPF